MPKNQRRFAVMTADYDRGTEIPPMRGISGASGGFVNKESGSLHILRRRSHDAAYTAVLTEYTPNITDEHLRQEVGLPWDGERQWIGEKQHCHNNECSLFSRSPLIILFAEHRQDFLLAPLQALVMETQGQKRQIRLIPVLRTDPLQCICRLPQQEGDERPLLPEEPTLHLRQMNIRRRR